MFLRWIIFRIQVNVTFIHNTQKIQVARLIPQVGFTSPQEVMIR